MSLMAPLLAMLEGLCGWQRGDFRVKLDDYAKIRDDVFEFCRFYARWLRNPLTERLKAEITKYWRGQLAGGEDKKLMTRWRRSR